MKTYFIAIVILLYTATVSAQLKEGVMVPEISLPNVKDSVVNLSSYRGKVVLIDFWASWCGPCRQANPSVVRLYKRYKDKGFEVFGVSVDESKAAWVKAIKQDKIKFTQVNSKGGLYSKVLELYGVEQIPTNFLLDKNGKLIAIDADGKELDKLVNQLLQHNN